MATPSKPPFQTIIEPPDETARLAALRACGILDAGAQHTFDTFAELAALVCATPMAWVSVIDTDHQRVLSHCGGAAFDIPREHAFCAHTILGDALLEIPDTRKDPRFASNPLVNDKPHVSFYAGMPLRTQDDHAIGTICVLDTRPRQLDAAQRDGLLRLGREAMSRLDGLHIRNLLHKTEQRLRLHDIQLQRLADFNALLARVNHIITNAEDEPGFLQSICDVALQDGHLKLAYIARPDDAGRFQFLATSGPAGYLDGLVISTNAEDPEGQGPAGRVWREGKANYTASFNASPVLTYWRARAARFGLKATATVPIRREGQMWAVLTVLHGEENVFDDTLQTLLDELALNVSRGLDRLDGIRRERELAAMQKTLLDNTFAGIVLVRDRHIVGANTRISQMLGYASPEQLIGKNTRFAYTTDAEYERIGRLYAELQQQGSMTVREVRIARLDGQEVLCDATVGLVEQDLSVWTYQDVTERVRLERELAYQVLHDPLSGLANRRALDAELPNVIARARRKTNVFALGMIDLDNFKTVNDTWGHEAGDRLLRELAQRLQSRLRASDFLARLGGDEFVVVIEEIDEMHAIEELNHAFNRLHQAVESPFEVCPGARAEVGMTMGLALYPLDAEDPDALIRQADAAMYQAKLHKHDRKQWWQLGVINAELPEIEAEFDPYNHAAAALLGKAQQYFKLVTEKFVDTFYANLESKPETHIILANLTEDEMRALMARQAEYFRFLLAPRTTWESIAKSATHLGEVHVLVGAGASLLVQSMTLYRRLLSEALSQAPMSARERYRIARIADSRLQDDLQIQLQAETRVLAPYFDVNSAALPPPGTSWADATKSEIAALGKLPGVQGALLMRLNPDGMFAVESSAGPRVEEITNILQTPGSEAVLDPNSPRGQGLSAQAWRSKQIVRCASYARDPRYQSWHDVAQKIGVRSTLSVPIINAASQVVAVISFFGGHPNQFESAAMQQFARGQQRRWEQIWLSSRTPAPVIPQSQSIAWRQTLFAGGLRMFMQPIVNLHTGRLVKVEALTRLQQTDGQIIPPGLFLPLLGNAELDHLFRLGLDQTLAQANAWEAHGLSIDVAINLAPTTLLDANCAAWVEEALHRHRIEPQRLTLELLETESIDASAQEFAINQLMRIGVNLAMDDLGSGYSSLQRLSTLPFDTIKIDQSLTLNLRKAPLLSMPLIRAIIQLGNDLQRQVVVEGLEDAGAIEAVVILGACMGQGYGLARPMRRDAFLSWYKSFVLPVEPGVIHTGLGALAYTWLRKQSATTEADPPFDEHPLTRFLIEQGLSDSPAAQWHARILTGDNAQDASQKLLAWLVERVIHEGNAA